MLTVINQLNALNGGGSVSSTTGGTDPNFASVQALLHLDGADLSTTFTDQKGHSFTANGAAALTTAQFKFGTASLNLSGNSQSIQTISTTDFGLGTGDVTLEGWFRPIVLTGFGSLWDMRTAEPSVKPRIYMDDTSGILIFYMNGSARITGTTGLSVNTWQHIAWTRASGSSKLFLNGTQEGSTYADGNDYGATAPLVIGGQFTPSVNDWPGQIDEFRLTVGVARYTANFTPPTAPFPNS